LVWNFGFVKNKKTVAITVQNTHTHTHTSVTCEIGDFYIFVYEDYRIETPLKVFRKALRYVFTIQFAEGFS